MFLNIDGKMLNYSKFFFALRKHQLNSTHTRCVIPKQEVVNYSCSTYNELIIVILYNNITDHPVS